MPKYTDLIDEAMLMIAKTDMVERFEDFLGMSDDEIDVCERALGVKFPDSYKYFLQRMGKDGGDFLRVCRIYFPFFLTNQKSFYWEYISDFYHKVKELNDETYNDLYKRRHVFLNDQGWTLYFYCSGLGYNQIESDPPIYEYIDGQHRMFEKSFALYIHKKAKLCLKEFENQNLK